MSKWIDVKDQLPEGNYDDLWLCSVYGEHSVGHYEGRGRFYAQAGPFAVAHWREIERPGEVQEDDQRDEDERNYCAIVQAGIDRMRR